MAAGWNVRALAAVCRAHLGTVLMFRGEWERAEVELSEAAAILAAAAGEGTDAVARFAELRRRQGRTDEAVELVRRAEHHPVANLCRAALALERGDAAAGADGAAQYLRLLGGDRLDVVGPAPAGLEGVPADLAVADDDDLGVAVGELARLVGLPILVLGWVAGLR